MDAFSGPNLPAALGNMRCNPGLGGREDASRCRALGRGGRSGAPEEVSMVKPLLIAFMTALLACGPASGYEGKKKTKPKKPETGASCKAPSVGRCAACSITCPPGEAASCSSGAMAGNVCHTQPSCRCGQ